MGLHMLCTTNQPLQIVDGIHSTIIVCHPEILATRYAAGGLAVGGSNVDDDSKDVMVPPTEVLQVLQLLVNLSKGLSGSPIYEILETKKLWKFELKSLTEISLKKIREMIFLQVFPY